MIALATDASYPRLKNHLIDQTGLAFYSDRENQLTELIGERISVLGLGDCSSYAQFLANGVQGAAEMDALIAKLTIGETFFFRDPGQFSAIGNIILPEILARKQAVKQLRIWSAGCATGAEPYSLAILLERELADRIAGWDIRIHATDLNRESLAKAAEGKFRPWALRSVPDDVKRECFSQDALTWTIHPRYKQWISFEQGNLAGREFPPGPFDLILCRNVMIYFSAELNRRVIAQFHQSLGECGWLLVGATEHNPESYQAFSTVTATGGTLYQKVSKPASPEAEVQAQPLPAPDPRTERLNPETHFHLALHLENLGKFAESEQSLRHAIYLDRNFALAHYHLGLALKRDGEGAAAARSFGNAMKVLNAMPGDSVLLAGREMTANDLKELTKVQSS